MEAEIGATAADQERYQTPADDEQTANERAPNGGPSIAAVRITSTEPFVVWPEGKASDESGTPTTWSAGGRGRSKTILSMVTRLAAAASAPSSASGNKARRDRRPSTSAAARPRQATTDPDPSRVTALAKAVTSGLRTLITVANNLWSSSHTGLEDEKQREDDKADQPGGTGRQPLPPVTRSDIEPPQVGAVGLSIALLPVVVCSTLCRPRSTVVNACCAQTESSDPEITSGPSGPSERTLKPMRVLIVEDEKGLAESMRRGLVGEGFVVDVFHDGVDGLWAASEFSYDVAILDIMLPGMNGYQVLKEVRDREIWTPVIMLTAKDGSTTRPTL